MSTDLSVIIPTFRRPRLLREALSSALIQTDVDLEVIVVDDSPEGSARDVVETIRDPRVAYLKNPKPTGGMPSATRNLGWPASQGRIIHFLDDDDLVPQHYYAAAVAEFDRRPHVGVVFGRVDPFGEAPPAQIESERRFFADAARRAATCSRFGPKLGFAARMMFDRTLLICSAAMVRRECVVQLGGFDPLIRLREDVDFYARAIRKYGASFIDEIAIRYRIGSPSLLHGPNLSDAEIKDLEIGRIRTQGNFRLEYGNLEYYALKIFTRLVLRAI